MKSLELLSIGIRLVGVYSILIALQMSVSQYGYIQQLELISKLPAPPKIIAMFIFPAIVLIAAILLIKFPTLISRWLLPKTNSDEVVLNGTAKDVQTALFCVLGVYILSWSLPDLAHNALMLWYTFSIDNMQYASPTHYIIQTAVTFVHISIGLFLCLKAYGLSQLLWRLRKAGVGKHSMTKESQ